MPCFTTGTLVTTKEGDIVAEDLRPGQLVLTRDNGYQPVRRVGLKTMTSRFLLDNPHLRPILILENAFGEGLPFRDTMVSPNTRLPVIETCGRFLAKEQEEMTAVKNLIDHNSVQQVDTVGVNYVLVIFDQHEIVATNGFWSECFVPADKSLGAIGNSQRNEVFEVFPEERVRMNRTRVAPTGQRSVDIGRLRRFFN